jgi:hypothetical protein
MAQQLDEFTRQFLETALWSSTDWETDKPLDDTHSIEDFAPATLAELVADCEAFQADNADDIAADPSRAGHDFWLTRCGHGAGFWDGDWPHDAGKRLTAAAKVYGNVDLYVGDDGLVYA